MENILKTILLEYEKSQFILDLVEHDSGATFVSITQNIQGIETSQKLKINPSVLTDILFVLQEYNEEIHKSFPSDRHAYFSEEKQNKVVARFLKGVSIEDLLLQFDCSKQIIEQILYNKGIEIPQQDKVKKYYHRRKKK
ncbi:MAG: hypothetical protein KBB37_09020 [Bacteroidia bacterium]|nr:hypothetical protein [Bacteroidia bacterium]MBP7261413.1 hypothetical protein [Bacteroidia bacterium]MBP9180962.1 hypothetical protein [Bacteroidia bacterium]MBP9725066.1 hypothetical protein [Bacteroidia bacterium]